VTDGRTDRQNCYNIERRASVWDKYLILSVVNELKNGSRSQATTQTNLNISETVQDRHTVIIDR